MRLIVTRRDGFITEIEHNGSGTLMELLRDMDVDVTAICGGTASCATCHIYVDAVSLPLLPPARSDETELLQGLSRVRPTSRLSCQIPLAAVPEGLHVTIGPEE